MNASSLTHAPAVSTAAAVEYTAGSRSSFEGLGLGFRVYRVWGFFRGVNTTADSDALKTFEGLMVFMGKGLGFRVKP